MDGLESGFDGLAQRVHAAEVVGDAVVERRFFGKLPSAGEELAHGVGDLVAEGGCFDEETGGTNVAGKAGGEIAGGGHDGLADVLIPAFDGLHLEGNPPKGRVCQLISGDVGRFLQSHEFAESGGDQGGFAFHVALGGVDARKADLGVEGAGVVGVGGDKGSESRAVFRKMGARKPDSFVAASGFRRRTLV